MGKKPTSLDDIDNFWDLESLLPQKRRIEPRREVNTDTVELEIDGDTPSQAQPHGRFGGSPIPQKPKDSPPPRPADEARRLRELAMRTKAKQNEPRPLDPYLIYEPESSVIKKVSVAKWPTRYTFYDKFRSDAHRLWERTSGECEPVSFFSYIPQYNQLSYAQLKWYLYWRGQARSGNFLPADYSYILLFIYEIINCPDLMPPERGLGLLCGVWLAYRPKYPRIENYLSEWLCDYCLIYQLPCPSKTLAPIMQAAVSAASFKEFYMGSAGILSGEIDTLAFTSNYDWRTSRYVTGENFSVFSEHINAAFAKVSRELLSDAENNDGERRTAIVRDAYSGALCVWDMKRCLTVEYISRTRSPKFRFVVTDIIRYSENRVRAALGIKARLKVDSLTEDMRRCIDEYFDEHLPVKKAVKTRKPLPENEYEKLYEPASPDFSLERALDIEKRSWSTTEILTSSFNDSSPNDNEPETDGFIPSEPPVKAPENTDKAANLSDLTCYDEPTENTADDPFAELFSALDGDCLDALTMLSGGDGQALTKIAARSGTLADALADRINETAFDIIGDALLEPDGAGYRIIPDYAEEMKSLRKER